MVSQLDWFYPGNVCSVLFSKRTHWPVRQDRGLGDTTHHAFHTVDEILSHIHFESKLQLDSGLLKSICLWGFSDELTFDKDSMVPSSLLVLLVWWSMVPIIVSEGDQTRAPQICHFGMMITLSIGNSRSRTSFITSSLLPEIDHKASHSPDILSKPARKEHLYHQTLWTDSKMVKAVQINPLRGSSSCFSSSPSYASLVTLPEFI